MAGRTGKGGKARGARAVLQQQETRGQGGALKTEGQPPAAGEEQSSWNGAANGDVSSQCACALSKDALPHARLSQEIRPQGREQAERPAPCAAKPDASACEGFSLSRSLERVLPCALWSQVEGRMCAIDADFRTVLMCLRRLTDPELTDAQRSLYLNRRFFKGDAPGDAGTVFAAFVTGGESGGSEVPVMDFEVDAGALYASFRQQYQIDLLRDRLHWKEFRELLSGLGEHTPFGARVRLRTLPDSHLTPEARAEVARARERIAIRPRVSKAQQALLQELERRLIAGEDPAEIIQRMQEE